MKANEVQVISGCCFVAERELFELIGLMDENYFLYNEEDDLCRRARQGGKKYAFFRKLQFSIYMPKVLIKLTTVKKLLWRHIKAIYIFILNIIPIFGI